MQEQVENKGKALRKTVARSEQAKFKLYKDRPTVLSMIEASNYDRLPELIPIRHARMSVSPFTFYRGTAGIMANDLNNLPHTNELVQAIGDCHLMNFGGFATPERTLVFDANDFDETFPAPWEWDIKRLATSFILAARNNHFSEGDAKDIVLSLLNSYRTHVQEFSQMNMLDLWYMKFDIQEMANTTKSAAARDLLDAAITQAHKETHQKVFYKLTQSVLGSFEIANQPPLVYHTIDVKKDKRILSIFFEKYLETLQYDRRWLVEKYKLIDAALKVVGVGSVGTRCYVALMMNENKEPLFIQVKEARKSVLDFSTTRRPRTHQGERVVNGQRLVQAASDIFLGWATGEQGRHFYLRQLRDKKIAPDVDHFNKEVLDGYARLCGRMLARAHVKTGNGTCISAYMGKSDVFDVAIKDFAVAYANQTEKDYGDFMKAIKAGKLPIEKE
ncbi:MAG: DUF2252 domain-containing protein [Filimonas sp.]|nr:DUF2252 domain-containing protein [Filimonas sp.]